MILFQGVINFAWRYYLYKLLYKMMMMMMIMMMMMSHTCNFKSAWHCALAADFEIIHLITS